MKLKTDDDGHAILQEGKPVYVQDDGKEAAFDVPDLYSKLIRDGKTIAELRKKTGDLEEKAKAWGDADPEAALKALEIVNNLDQGKLVAAGKVEEIKATAKKAAEEAVAAAALAHKQKLEAAEAERDRFKTQLHRETINNAFATSPFIAEKIAAPIDMLMALFAPRFTVGDDGRIVAKGADGNAISSRTKFGDPANFEEAIETLVSEYAHKDQILKGTGNRGDGTRHNNGTGDRPHQPAKGAMAGTKEQRVAAIGAMFKDLPVS